MYRDIVMRAVSFAVFVVIWLAGGGSAALLWRAVIVVGVGLALHAWVRHHRRGSGHNGPS